MSTLADQITGTGLISQVDDGIFLNSPAPVAASETSNALATQTNATQNSIASWLDQNFATPVLNNVPGASTLANSLGLASTSASGSVTSDSFWTDIFLRGVIIILGFIFTAIGLSMFGNKAAQVVINETKRSFNA